MDAGPPKDRARIVRRTGVRKKRSRPPRQTSGIDGTFTTASSPLARSNFTSFNEATDFVAESQHENLDIMQHGSPIASGRPGGFISSNSVLSSAPTATSGDEAASPGTPIPFGSTNILDQTGSDILPRGPIMHALTDAFFEHVFPFYPVVDPSDMGVHKQQRHANHDRPGLLRRIFWHLVNVDKIMVACWGRPSAILLEHCDVAMPSLQDFPQQGNVRSDIAMRIFQLGTITGTVVDMTSRRKTPSKEDMSNVIASLRSWHDTLPWHLRLFDSNGQRLAYDRIVSEMFIFYLVTIILSQMLMCKETSAFQPSVVSIVSSHCIAALYDEIHCRRDAQHLMQTHGFLCMAAAVPLLFSVRASQEEESYNQESLDILCAVLGELRQKFGGSDLVLKKINRLQLERANTRTNTSSRAQDEEQTDAWHKDILEQASGLLLPFPAEFCKAIKFLHTRNDDSRQHDAYESMPGGSGLAEYIDPACTIMDILGLESTTDNFWLG
ncbi:hypothetical protein PFICI_12541 [Pestalotiopsis fici W106-1]|uniref:Transcription factor domain-containing protein n=1 Tax=Pestalotiopsis fici (strain W106-1 / CGMCC3.15140) TaxID=1229662 RepID=W3WR06_PESFW|nr:uncharacterized protein PFICI_12541 [Pestalotiopsis fici W106-1]ETS75597.1 hypothetical protein PFICI_12541 [Pestalotiopsis fici W106-1]